MIVLAAVLTAAININIDSVRLPGISGIQQPRMECGITTVGYRFHGKPGQTFRYAGDEYEIPNEGYVELIASRRRKTYRIHDRDLPLDVWPVGMFGFRDVPMPAPKPVETAETQTALPKVRPLTMMR